MHEPPVQSDCCAFSGNYLLESNPERHDKTPLAAATGNRISRARYVGGATEFLKWWPNYGYTGRTDLVTCLAQDCYHGSETCRFTEPSKNHLAGWFFRLQSKRLRCQRKDLKRILFNIPSPEGKPATPVNLQKSQTI